MVYISLSSPDIRTWYNPINRIPLVHFSLYIFHISIRIFVQICIIFRLQPYVYSENYVKLHSFPNKQTKSQTLCNKIPRLTNILSNGESFCFRWVLIIPAVRFLNLFLLWQATKGRASRAKC